MILIDLKNYNMKRIKNIRTIFILLAMLLSYGATAMAQAKELVKMTTSGSSVKITAKWTGSGYLYAKDGAFSIKNNVETTISITGAFNLVALGDVTLTELSCSNNQLTVLDVTKCPELTLLYCSRNNLTSLTVSTCTALKELSCYRNLLTTLDVSKCTKLELLQCGENQLTAVDVTACTPLKTLNLEDSPKLKTVRCYNLNLSSLRLSGCKVLELLYCNGNKLTSLDVSSCELLRTLSCGSNLFTSLNVSSCTILKELYCTYSKLTSFTRIGLYLETLALSYSTDLKELACAENNMTTLELVGCTALKKVECNINKLTSLNVSNCTALEQLSCWNNQLPSLNVTTCKNLKQLHCGNNPKLQTLRCEGLQLTSLDIANCPELTTLYCYNNQLTTLDLKGTKITNLRADGQSVTVSKTGTNYPNPVSYTNKTAAEKVKINGNLYSKGDNLPLPTLGNALTFTTENTASTNNAYVFSGTIALAGYTPPTPVEMATMNTTALTVSISVVWTGTGIITANDKEIKNNEFETITASGGKVTLKSIGDVKLTELYCAGNKLTSLNVSKCTDLTLLACLDNQLPDLNVSYCKQLAALYCHTNRISNLNLLGCTKLTTIQAHKQSVSISKTGDSYFNSILYNSRTGKSNIQVNGNSYESGWALPLPLSGNTLNFTTSDLTGDGYPYSGTITLAGYAPTPVQVATMKTTKPSVEITVNYAGDGKVFVQGTTELKSAEKTVVTPIDGQVSISMLGSVFITFLNCSGNDLTELDVSGCTALTDLWCDNNLLTELDVSKCAALKALWCNVNQLSALDVSNCTMLTTLCCNTNKLVSLNVSMCNDLVRLWCDDNRLTSLNIKGCTKLTNFHAENQSISVTATGSNYKNPILYTNKTGVEGVRIDGASYANGVNLPLPYTEREVSFTTTDPTGGTQAFSGIIKLEGYTPAGIDDASRPALLAYPNPTVGWVTVTGIVPGKVLKLYSTTGSLVGTYKVDAEEIKLDLSRFNRGMYFLNYEGYTFKIIKH